MAGASGPTTRRGRASGERLRPLGSLRCLLRQRLDLPYGMVATRVGTRTDGARDHKQRRRTSSRALLLRWANVWDNGDHQTPDDVLQWPRLFSHQEAISSRPRFSAQAPLLGDPPWPSASWNVRPRADVHGSRRGSLPLERLRHMLEYSYVIPIEEKETWIQQTSKTRRWTLRKACKDASDQNFFVDDHPHISEVLSVLEETAQAKHYSFAHYARRLPTWWEAVTTRKAGRAYILRDSQGRGVCTSLMVNDTRSAFYLAGRDAPRRTKGLPHERPFDPSHDRGRPSDGS